MRPYRDLGELPATFNARAETLSEKPMFRAAFKSRRCIVPASGFYEWTGEKGRKIPHYFSSADGLPLALAGLWEPWRDPNGQELFSATIVVGAANGWMSRFHDRMPILISWSDAKKWIAGEDAATLLEAAPEEALQEWTVSTRVNRSGAADDDPTLIARI